MVDDPARALALLWGVDEPPARGPRRGLSTERVVRAATVLADADGLDAVSMRTVAERLGVGAMTLYRYVPGKGVLLDLMLDRVLAELAAEPEPPEEDVGWRGRLEAVARARWALGLRHPWVLALPTSRPVLGPGETAAYDRELRAVEGLGLDDVAMDAVVTLVVGWATAATRAAVEVRTARERSSLGDADWWAATGPLLAQVLDPDRFPLAVRVGAAVGEAQGTAFDPERAFAFGLARILDGVAVLVADGA